MQCEGGNYICDENDLGVKTACPANYPYCIKEVSGSWGSLTAERCRPSMKKPLTKEPHAIAPLRLLIGLCIDLAYLTWKKTFKQRVEVYR
jgi:hypothetical protein